MTGAANPALPGIMRLSCALVTTALADLGRGLRGSPVPGELLRMASWRAARDGLGGRALDVFSGRLAPARLMVDRLVHVVRDALCASGDLDLVERLLSAVDRFGTRADRQRRAFREAGKPAGLVDRLADETLLGCERWSVTAVPDPR